MKKRFFEIFQLKKKGFIKILKSSLFRLKK